MSAETKVATTGGVSFTTLLAVLFIGLKLTGHIDWSWFWVLCPLWIGLVAFVGVLLMLLVFAGVWLGASTLLKRWG